MVRPVGMLVLAVVGAVLWAQQAFAWPPTRWECQDRFLKVELPNYFMFVNDDGGLDYGSSGKMISYRPGEPFEQVVRKTKGKDLLDAGVIEIENFRVADRRDYNNQYVKTENVLFSARLIATETFQVVAYNDGKEWKPKIIKSLEPDANEAAYVEKGTIFRGMGWMQFTERLPREVPPEEWMGMGVPSPDVGPPAQEAKPWWQK